MPDDRLYTDADVAAGARAITAALGSRPWRQMTPRTAARAVLDALTAAGWRPLSRAFGFIDVDGRWHDPSDITVAYPQAIAREVGGTTGEETT